MFGSLVPSDPVDEAIGLAMQGYWTRLARGGDPNGDEAHLWPLYDDESDQRINFDAEISVQTGFRRAECEFWWEEVYAAAFE